MEVFFFWIFQINDSLHYKIILSFLGKYNFINLIQYLTFNFYKIEKEFLHIFDYYYNIIYYIFICFLISIILFVLSFFFFIRPVKYNEKLLPYECGFDPFNDARKQSDITFYLIALFFIIFDIEAIFIFPWTVSFLELNFYGFFNMVDFLLELGIALFYIIFMKIIK